ncbi:MAG: glycosyltransferase family 9 protein [Burkholderiaceae bacterium]|nr:glycosyltransferase family 9 protein [Burkholderiaceae bacterium]
MSDSVVFLRSMQYFGDQLAAYPLLYQLKQCRPDHKIRVVAHDPVQAYYADLPWVDEFIQADRFIDKYRAITKKTNLVMALHHSSEKYGALALLRWPALRLGFKNQRVTDFVWNHSWPKDMDEYIGLANLNLLRRTYDFAPEVAARGCMAAIAAGAQASTSTADVVMMPGGGAGQFKRWGVRNYVALADQLKTVLGQDASFCFILGPAEVEETAYLQSLARPDFQLLISQPIADIAYVALHSRLIVANDCGPSHLAQNTCRPYVGLFNEPNLEWFWSRDNSASVTPTNGTTDIQSISIAQVFSACQKVLAV